MKTCSVEKLARMLRAAVLVTLAVNLAALVLVPCAVLLRAEDLPGGVWSWLYGLLHPGEDDITAAGYAFILLAWFWVWQRADAAVTCLFLLFSGCCSAVVLRQGLRVLDAVLRGEPFSAENAASLRRTAVCAFAIAAAALARTVFCVCRLRSLRPLLTYTALFIPVFVMAGLLCLILSALFRQAAELKAENDLTI